MRFPINCNDSTSVWAMTANPITGTVRVTFTSGPAEYHFTGESRRAILSAAIIAPVSMGQWINRHCWG